MKTIFLYIVIFYSTISYAEKNVFDILEQEQIGDLSFDEPEQESTEEDILNESNDLLKDNNISKLTDNLDKKSQNSANIRVLNKIFSKNIILNIPIGSFVNFDNINFKVINCFKSQSSDSALVQIHSEHGEFNSWIFADDPAISIFEHPIYSLALINCRAK